MKITVLTWYLHEIRVYGENKSFNACVTRA